LSVGDKVEMSATEEPVTETRLDPIDLKLEVLYEDDLCLVISKPEGYAVHPGAGMAADEPTVLHGVVDLFKKRKIPFSSSAVLVHRLDKETTGCLLIAKTPEAHKMLQKQFEDRSVRKTYLAIVAGVPDPETAMIDAAIGRSASNRTKMTVFGSAKTRDARTTYRTLDVTKDAALLACELHTGRTHQIRVHMHSIHHPIMGDVTYFSSQSQVLEEHYEIHDLCLHAWQLSFVSPADHKEHTVKAAPSESFLDSMKKIGLTYRF
jgi:23S rRNA pseudouridine1911/1915/1917 synthase